MRAFALLAALPWLVAAAPPTAELWYAHAAMVMMLGEADSIRVTVDAPSAQPWMYRVAPQMRKATVVAGGAVNVETLLANRIKLAFVMRPEQAVPLRRLGIDTRVVGFNDVPGMLASLRATANALGTPLAHNRERDYERYTNDTIVKIQKRLVSVPIDRRPRVLHLASISPLEADGSGTMIDEWIHLAGGRNAATGLAGALKPVTVEQILRWNPDIIIVGGQAKTALGHDLSTIPALQGKRIVKNPSGVFAWDRYGPEFPLQLLWAARQLNPSLFRELDLERECRDFYRRFYSYNLSPAEAHLILTGQGPAR
jgi:iron complex transport system substrate-binding protein